SSQYRIRWKQEGVMDESKWWMTVAAHWILSRQKDRSKAKSFEGCRSSVPMTMHEVVHEMVVEECYEPNSEGSGSALKAYMNARVAGLFLLVLLEYPNGKGVVRATSRDSIWHYTGRELGSLP
ncbi:hypothetical protein Tco_0203881, partial [Tanacetum coccineum]